MKATFKQVFGIFSVAALSLSTAPANPLRGVVVNGAANINSAGSLLTINQTSASAIINWGSFSIANGETTLFQFNGPAGFNSAVLNRVNIGNPSIIAGMLRSTIGPGGPVGGTVMILNPSGILFTPTAQINVGTLVGSTLQLADDNEFLNHASLHLSGSSTASIQNQGKVNALGDVYLIAHTVQNSGNITAGNVAGLAAGSAVTLMQSGHERLSVQAGTPGTGAAVGVDNTVGAQINAVTAELKAAGGNIYALAINNGGVVRADSVVNEGGHIYLRASGGNIQNSGTLTAQSGAASGGTIVVDGGHNAVAASTVIDSGTIEARGDAPGAKGGTVEMLGDHVGLFDSALVNVSGQAGGGTALIGGDYHGANPSIQNAEAAFVSSGSQIKADALALGDGGKVVVWSDGATRFYGSISARGGARGGNGGFVETSGHYLDFQGTVSTLAPQGSAGSLLLDPVDLTLDNNNPSSSVLGVGGVFAPSASPSHLSWSDVDNQLSLSDVTVTTYSPPGFDAGQAGNIIVAAPSPILNRNNKLTLNAAGALTISGGIVNNGSGELDLDAAGQVAINADISLGGRLSVAGSSILFGGSGSTRSMTTSGGQDYNGPTLLGINTFLKDTGDGAINFHSTINAQGPTITSITPGTVGGAPGVTLSWPDAYYNFSVLGSATPGGPYNAPNGAVVLSHYSEFVPFSSGDSFFRLDSSAGLAAGAYSLTLSAPVGGVTFGGAVGGTIAVGALDVTGPSQINGHQVNTFGGQTYHNAVTLGADTVINAQANAGAPAPDVTFEQTVDSQASGTPLASKLWTLTVNDPGLTWFEGNVGAAQAGGVTVGQLGALTTDAAGTTRLGNEGNSIQPESVYTKPDTTVGHATTGDQVYNDPVQLWADTTITAQDSAGEVRPPNVTFGQTVDSQASGTPLASKLWTLTVNDPGLTWFEGNVGAAQAGGVTVGQLGALTTDAAGTARLGNEGNSIQPESVYTKPDTTVGHATTGDQVYNDPVQLWADTTITAQDSAGEVRPPNVTFGQTVDSQASGTPLASKLWTLTVNDPGLTWFEGNVGAAQAGGVTVGQLGALTTDAAGTARLGNEGNSIQPESVYTKPDTTVGHATTGDQVYNDPVQLWADTTITAQDSAGEVRPPNVTFGQTVDSQASGTPLASKLWTLTVNDPGLTWFEGNVGAAQAGGVTVGQLGALTTDAAGTARLGNEGNSIQPESVYTKPDTTVGHATTGDQVYNDPVQLWADTTITAQDSAGEVRPPNVTFGQTVDSQASGTPLASKLWTLTVNDPGLTWFEGNVGAAQAGGVTVGQLGALTTDAAGTARLGNEGNSIQPESVYTRPDTTVGHATTGDQVYNDPVQLWADTTITAQDSAGEVRPPNVTFGQTVDSQASGTPLASKLWTLTVNDPGLTWFEGNVGAAQAGGVTVGQLGALTTDAAGTARLGNEGNSIQPESVYTRPDTTVGHATTGDQAYNDPVQLWADTTITAQDSAGEVRPPNVTFGQTVDSQASGTPLASKLWTLTVNDPGLTWFEGNVGAAQAGGVTVGQLGALTTDAAGTARLGNEGNSIQPESVYTRPDTTVGHATTGDQVYNDPVQLWADTTITAQDSAGEVRPPNVTFGQTVDSQASGTPLASKLWTLTVNDPGLTWFEGNVGAAQAGGVTVGQLGALTTDAAGTARLGNEGNSIQPESVYTRPDTTVGHATTGDQVYNDPVQLWADTTITAQDSAGEVRPPNVTFGQTVDSQASGTPLASKLWTLTVNDPGLTWFEGNVGAAQAGGVTVGQLGALTTDAAGTARLGNEGNSIQPESVYTRPDTTVGHATTGDQVYNDPVQLWADTTITAQDSAGEVRPPNVTFGQTVDSQASGTPLASKLWTLTVNDPGLTWFEGNVGAAQAGGVTVGQLGALTTDAAGTARLGNEGNSIQPESVYTRPDTTVGHATTGDQAYNDPVQLWADTTITAQDSAGEVRPPNVTFGQTVDSQASGTPLASKLWTLTVNDPGLTWFEGNVGAAQAGGVTVGQLGALTTDAAGTARLGNEGNSIQPESVYTRPDTTVGHATTGDQVYNDPVQLWADTTITAQDSAGEVRPPNVTFGQTVDSQASGTPLASKLWTLTVNDPGLTWFRGDVGTAKAGTPAVTVGQLGALVTDAAGSTRLGNEAALAALGTPQAETVYTKPDVSGNHPLTGTTSGEQTYNDPVVLWADTTINAQPNGTPQVNPNVTFGQTVDSQASGTPLASKLWTLTVNDPGLTWFEGNVGAAQAGTPAVTVGQLGALVTDAAGSTRLGNEAALAALGTPQAETVYTKPDVSGNHPLTGTTSGEQTYNDPVVLWADTTINAQPNGTPQVNPNVTFGQTVDSQASGTPLASKLWTLTVNDPGLTWFEGNVGAAQAGTPAVTVGQLGALVTDAAGSTRLGNEAALAALGTPQAETVYTKPDVSGNHPLTGTTSGEQTYNDPVVLWADTTINAQPNGTPQVNPNVTFGQTVDSQASGTPLASKLWTLTVNDPGLTWFEGNVGAAQAGTPAVTVGQLGALVTDAAGSTRLGNEAALAALGTPQAETVYTKPDVSGNHPLTGTTSGEQTYNDPVVLWADTTINAQPNGTPQVNPNVTFGQTVDSQASGTPLASKLWTLTVNDPGLTWFEGNVGAAQAGTPAVTVGQLGALVTDAAGSTRLGNEAALAALGTPQAETVYTKPDVSGNHPLTGTTSGEQTYNDPVVLWADTTINAQPNGTPQVNPNVTFGQTVDSQASGAPLASKLWTLTVNDPGLTWFGGNVGAAQAGTPAVTVGQLGALTTDAPGQTHLGGLGARETINTKGNQSYNDPVTLEADTSLSSSAGSIGLNAAVIGNGNDLTATAAGSINLFSLANGGAVSLQAPSKTVGDVSAQSIGTSGGSTTINGVQDIVNDAAYDMTTVNAQVNAHSASFASANLNVLGGGVSTKGGGQSYNGPVALDAPTVLTDSGGNIVFYSTISGVATLTTDASGQRGGSAFVNVEGTSANPSIWTSGAQTYNDTFSLGANVFLAGTSFEFPGGVQLNGFNLSPDYIAAGGGGFSLEVNTPGNEVFNGRVSPGAGGGGGGGGAGGGGGGGGGAGGGNAQQPNNGLQPQLFTLVPDEDRRILESIMPQVRKGRVTKAKYEGTPIPIRNAIATRSFQVPVEEQAVVPIDEQSINLP